MEPAASTFGFWIKLFQSLTKWCLKVSHELLRIQRENPFNKLKDFFVAQRTFWWSKNVKCRNNLWIIITKNITICLKFSKNRPPSPLAHVCYWRFPLEKSNRKHKLMILKTLAFCLYWTDIVRNCENGFAAVENVPSIRNFRCFFPISVLISSITFGLWNTQNECFEDNTVPE